MRVSFFSIFFLAIAFSYILVAPTYVSAQLPQLTFSDLNFGVDTRFTTNQDSVISPVYSNQAFGFSGRFQTSVVANYVQRGKNKRFLIGDMVGGELTTGLFKSENPDKKEPLWFAFRFDLGVGTLYRINDHQQVGLNWVMMRFANDFISEYISGSEMQLRYRYKKFSFEVGTIGRYIRMGGFLETYYKSDVDRNMTSLGFRYLIDESHNLGVRTEVFQAEALTVRDKLFNLRLYYGLYF